MLAYTHSIPHSIHTLHLKFGLGLFYTTSCGWSEYISLPLSVSFIGRVSFSSSHHRALQTAIKTDVLHWLCMGRERRERKKGETRGDTSEGDRKRERKRGSMRGKMYSTTSPSKPWLIPCLLIFITIAASCKMFDGFVQILVPLIHNYCYTCRTKGNFRRGAVWKAAARL